LNLLRLASRIDGVASRVQTAVTLRKVTANMAGVVNGMEKAMKSMNLEQVSAIMDKFEKQFEDMDVQTATMETSMGQTISTLTPQDQVESFMQQIADENGLELQLSLPQTTAELKEKKEQDVLSERLAKLRNT
jgi:charged multivesicular body protein 1